MFSKLGMVSTNHDTTELNDSIKFCCENICEEFFLNFLETTKIQFFEIENLKLICGGGASPKMDMQNKLVSFTLNLNVHTNISQNIMPMKKKKKLV